MTGVQTCALPISATDETDIVTQFKLKLQAIVDAIKATLLGQSEDGATEVVALVEKETEVHTVVTVDSTADAV